MTCLYLEIRRSKLLRDQANSISITDKHVDGILYVGVLSTFRGRGLGPQGGGAKLRHRPRLESTGEDI